MKWVRKQFYINCDDDKWIALNGNISSELLKLFGITYQIIFKGYMNTYCGSCNYYGLFNRGALGVDEEVGILL